ncbi:MAG: AraC family transcriptional regulator ligand-binding domain-containing protein [Proteobacteria bacterium]|nr:AraC family transcriptional regulator ligand-binding domain-containing protein [Pseudomonadota bacterium]
MQEIPTAYAVMMVRDASQQGEDLLYGLTIDMEVIEKQEFFPFDDFLTILERYTRWNDQLDWGFEFGHRLGIASHGALGFGAMSAPTVRDGLTFLARYIRTRACYARSSVITANDTIKVTITLDEQVQPYIRRMSETLSMIFQSYIESAGASSAPTLWHFPFPEQEDSAFYARWLHGGYRFSADVLMLEVPGSVGMVVSALRDETIYQSSIAQCEAILSSMREDPTLARVRNSLSAAYEMRMNETSPSTPIPDAIHIADTMGISKRTLIRKLKECGTTFQKVRDGLLREKIQRLIRREQLPMLEIGHRLGYQDAANFSRACKRLFGEPPGSLRARLLF